MDNGNCLNEAYWHLQKYFLMRNTQILNPVFENPKSFNGFKTNSNLETLQNESSKKNILTVEKAAITSKENNMNTNVSSSRSSKKFQENSKISNVKLEQSKKKSNNASKKSLTSNSINTTIEI